MTRWVHGLILAALPAAGLLSAVGCCNEPALKAKNAELVSANEGMQERLRQCNEQRAQAERDREAATMQLQAQNQELMTLRMQAARVQELPPPPPPVPGAQPGQGGGEDLAGEGRTVEQAPGMVLVTMPGDMLFASGKADLTPRGRTVVNEIADVLRAKYAGKVVRVVGHTDSDPIVRSGWKDNWDLSFNRARAVGLALIARGVSGKNVEMVGVADNAPRVSPERTAADKAQNRRVVIQVVQ